MKGAPQFMLPAVALTISRFVETKANAPNSHIGPGEYRVAYNVAVKVLPTFVVDGIVK